MSNDHRNESGPDAYWNMMYFPAPLKGMTAQVELRVRVGNGAEAL